MSGIVLKNRLMQIAGKVEYRWRITVSQ